MMVPDESVDKQPPVSVDSVIHPALSYYCTLSYDYTLSYSGSDTPYTISMHYGVLIQEPLPE